jgi:uncharacterized protein (DUF1501 family)
MSDRRSFLRRSLGVAVLGGTLPAAFMRAAAAQSLPALGSTIDPSNVLVVIAMSGGNDGLNTVVPWSDDAYHRARPVIGIADSAVLKLNDRIGLNPALAGLNELYAQGRLAIVQGVGYANPNRSHFEATQIWETRFARAPTRNRVAGANARSRVSQREQTAVALRGGRFGRYAPRRARCRPRRRCGHRCTQ